MMLVFLIATAALLVSGHAAAFQPSVSHLASDSNGPEDIKKTLWGKYMNRSDELHLSFRLPGDTIPKAYNLRLFPNLRTLQVSGEVIIEVHIKNKTNTITLHAPSNLNISSILLSRKSNGQNIRITSIVITHETQQLRINVRSILEKYDLYTLHINFHYNISQLPHGFFGGRYLDGNVTK